MKKNITVLLILTAIVSTVFYQNIHAFTRNAVIAHQQEPVKKLIELLHNPTDDYVLVVSHRGDWRNAPENSIQAIKNCVEMGVDMVEIDVRMTKDSVLVLMHDKTLDRTTSGTGSVNEWTYDSLQTLNLQNGQLRVTHHKIPTLEEAMLTAKGKILVNLDKAANYLDMVYKILEKTGTTEQVLVKGSKTYSEVKAQYGILLDEFTYMPVVSENNPELEGFIDYFITELDPVAFEVLYSSDDSPMFSMIKKIKANGSRVWVNTLWESLCGVHDDDRAVDDVDGTWGWVIDHGANIIQTDRPAMLIEYLQMKGLHD